jgi:nicotinate-nucleotide adenylyltransferase
MTVLACAGDRRLIPSLLEAPTAEDKPCYSIDTVRKVLRSLHKDDRLFFLIGVDAFLDLPHWKEYRRLLNLVDFIVVSRPGFDADEIRKVVQKEMSRPAAAHLHPPAPSSARKGLRSSAGRLDTIRLRHSTLYVLRGVQMHVASHAIRQAIGSGRTVTGLVPRLVEEYILKEGLYGPHRPTSEVWAPGHAPLQSGCGGK